MRLKYVGLPMDSLERGAILLSKGVEHAVFGQRFSRDAMDSLKSEVDTLCALWHTSLYEDFLKWTVREARWQKKEQDKRLNTLGRKGKDGVRVLDTENSIYCSCLLYVIRRELDFRLGMVEACVSYLLKRHVESVRPDKIGRRILLNKYRWPFPRYEPSMARVRRTRPGAPKALEPEYPKPLDWRAEDLGELLED